MSPTDHPGDQIDDTVHQRHRLGILVVLSETRRADFSYLRSTLGLTDGNLGRHLEVLEKAGYVEITKTFEHRKPRTWASLTPTGSDALAAELDVLERIVRRSRAPLQDPSPRRTAGTRRLTGPQPA